MMPLAKPRKQYPGLQTPYFHVSAVLGPAVVDLAVFLQQVVYNLSSYIHCILTHPSGAISSALHCPHPHGIDRETEAEGASLPMPVLGGKTGIRTRQYNTRASVL